MSRTVISAIVLFGALLLPFCVSLQTDAVKADARPSPPAKNKANTSSSRPTKEVSETKTSRADEHVEMVLARFETLQSHDWNESRYAVTQMLSDMRSMAPESDELKKSLKGYRKNVIIPYLMERLDFRRTRDLDRPRFGPGDFRKPMYPVTMTLIDMGSAVIDPLLNAVAEQERSATYLYQARIVLTRLSGGKEKFERLIQKYAKERPKAAGRIRQLSYKHDLAPQMKKKEAYHLLLLMLLSRLEPKGMLIPKKSETTLKQLRALEKLMPSDKK